MALARSKITSQNQISIPAEVRKKLGVGPGSSIEWDEEGDKIVVRRSGKYTFDDIRRVLFPDGPPSSHTVEEMDEGIREYMRKRHARR
jgi:antitoxin PrlF